MNKQVNGKIDDRPSKRCNLDPQQEAKMSQKQIKFCMKRIY